MIQETETERCRVKVIPLHIQLLDRRVNVMGQVKVLRSRTTPFVFIRRDVRAESLQRAETITRVRLDRALAFDHLHTNVIIFGARIAQVTDAAPVKPLTTPWCSGIASVAPDSFTVADEQEQAESHWE